MRRQIFRSNMLRTCALGALAVALPLAAQPKYVVVDLGGVGAPATQTSAIAINNAGQVTGNSNRADFSTYRAYRTAPNATINPATDLIPPLPGGTYSAVNLNSTWHRRSCLCWLPSATRRKATKRI